MSESVRILALVAVVATVSCFAESESLSEASLLEYASAPYDKGTYIQQREHLGKLNGAEVVADFICSDVCPDYTVRIIHFDVEPGKKCAAAGGVEKSVVVPFAIAVTEKVFCFPRILTDNWDAYVR